MSWEMTLQSIRDEGPCRPGWEKLRRSVGVRAPLSTVVTLEQILESNGVEDAQWALRCIKGHDREIRLYAVQCACRVRHLMIYPSSIYALECSVLYAEGLEDDAAGDAAGDAAWAAVWVAVWAVVKTAIWAARAAAKAAAWDVRAAVWNVAGDVRAAVWDVAGDAAGDAERKWQAEEMLRMIRGEGIYGRNWADNL